MSLEAYVQSVSRFARPMRGSPTWAPPDWARMKAENRAGSQEGRRSWFRYGRKCQEETIAGWAQLHGELPALEIIRKTARVDSEARGVESENPVGRRSQRKHVRLPGIKVWRESAARTGGEQGDGELIRRQIR